MISIRSLKAIRREGPDWEWAERLKRGFRSRARKRQRFYLTLDELLEVLRYKLRDQFGRASARRSQWSDRLVRTVTLATFAVRSRNRSFELVVSTGILTALPGVGVPIASAVLALVRPERYGILDSRAWRQLFDEERKTFTIPDYMRYMERVWPLAHTLGWPPQRVDWCTWRYDDLLKKRGGLGRAAISARSA